MGLEGIVSKRRARGTARALGYRIFLRLTIQLSLKNLVQSHCLQVRFQSPLLLAINPYPFALAAHHLPRRAARGSSTVAWSGAPGLRTFARFREHPVG